MISRTIAIFCLIVLPAISAVITAIVGGFELSETKMFSSWDEFTKNLQILLNINDMANNRLILMLYIVICLFFGWVFSVFCDHGSGWFLIPSFFLSLWFGFSLVGLSFPKMLETGGTDRYDYNGNKPGLTTYDKIIIILLNISFMIGFFSLAWWISGNAKAEFEGQVNRAKNIRLDASIARLMGKERYSPDEAHAEIAAAQDKSNKPVISRNQFDIRAKALAEHIDAAKAKKGKKKKG
jgi:hypothetical protein